MDKNRQKKILNFIAVYKEIKIDHLCNLLNVSPSTVRRELSNMESSGLLVRKYGVAKSLSPIQYEASYEKRALQQINAKRAIALTAREMIQPGMVIGLMGGTTCTELARLLRPMEQITVVTNAVNICLELQGGLNKRIMVTGGNLNHNSYELVGSQTNESLKHVHLSLAFLGVSGISTEFGVSMSDEPEANAGKAFMDAADCIIVLADNTKIGNTTYARVCPLSEIDHLITDRNVSPEKIDLFGKMGVKVHIADLE